MSIFGKCLALRTTTVILWATGWYDRDTWSSPLLMHFCEEERAGERPHRGRGEPKQERGAAGRCSGRQESLSCCGRPGRKRSHCAPTLGGAVRVGRGPFLEFLAWSAGRGWEKENQRRERLKSLAHSRSRSGRNRSSSYQVLFLVSPQPHRPVTCPRNSTPVEQKQAVRTARPASRPPTDCAGRAARRRTRGTPRSLRFDYTPQPPRGRKPRCSFARLKHFPGLVSARSTWQRAPRRRGRAFRFSGLKHRANALFGWAPWPFLLAGREPRVCSAPRVCSCRSRASASGGAEVTAGCLGDQQAAGCRLGKNVDSFSPLSTVERHQGSHPSGK